MGVRGPNYDVIRRQKLWLMGQTVVRGPNYAVVRGPNSSSWTQLYWWFVGLTVVRGPNCGSWDPTVVRVVQLQAPITIVYRQSQK